MVDNKYAVAYSEVLEILKYIPVEDYNKIPETKIELFKANANNDYTFNYNPNKTLEEQNVSNIAKGIIMLLWLNRQIYYLKFPLYHIYQKYNFLLLQNLFQQMYN